LHTKVLSSPREDNECILAKIYKHLKDKKFNKCFRMMSGNTMN
jgi:hypothetical protein